MKRSLMVLALCSFLISCSTFSSGDQPAQTSGNENGMGPGGSASGAPVDPTLAEAAAPVGESGQAVTQGQAAGDFPADAMPAQVPPGTQQVTIDQPPVEKAPRLKPSHPSSSWTAQSAALNDPPAGSGGSSSWSDKPSKKSAAKKASVKNASKYFANNKHGKKSKAQAKHPTKEQCKKFAKFPKKHKKELAICKMDKKKAAKKGKKSGKVARG